MLGCSLSVIVNNICPVVLSILYNLAHVIFTHSQACCTSSSTPFTTGRSKQRISSSGSSLLLACLPSTSPLVWYGMVWFSRSDNHDFNFSSLILPRNGDCCVHINRYCTLQHRQTPCMRTGPREYNTHVEQRNLYRRVSLFASQSVTHLNSTYSKDACWNYDKNSPRVPFCTGLYNTNDTMPCRLWALSCIETLSVLRTQHTYPTCSSGASTPPLDSLMPRLSRYGLVWYSIKYSTPCMYDSIHFVCMPVFNLLHCRAKCMSTLSRRPICPMGLCIQSSSTAGIVMPYQQILWQCMPNIFYINRSSSVKHLQVKAHSNCL